MQAHAGNGPDGKPEGEPDPDSLRPLVLQTERDLRANIRRICRRLDAQPALSRLLFINPLLVLEDVGVQMSPTVREHIIQALRFPPKRRVRIEALQTEVAALGRQCAEVDGDAAGAAGPTPVAAPRVGHDQTQHAASNTAEHAADLAAQTPLRVQLATRQAELARLQQGALVFFPRSIYEQFKRGEKKHRWIKAVRFGV